MRSLTPFMVKVGLATTPMLGAINATLINADLDAVVTILGGVTLVVGGIVGLIITLVVVKMISGILIGIKDGIVNSIRF